MAARAVARLTARVVQPTPPAAPVTVMIRGPSSPWSWIVPAPGQSRDDIEYLGRLRRQREELARSGADGFQDQAAIGAAARGQDDRGGIDLVKFLDQLDSLVGVVVEDHDRDMRGDFVRAVHGFFIATQDFGKPDGGDPSQQPLQGGPRLLDGIDQDDSDHILHGVRLGLKSRR